MMDSTTTKYSGLTCREVPPGNGYCVYCAEGEPDKCLYVKPSQLRSVPTPNVPTSKRRPNWVHRYIGYVLLVLSMFIDGAVGWVVFALAAYLILFGEHKW